MNKCLNKFQRNSNNKLNEIKKKMQAMKEKFKRIETVKKNQIEILEMKTSINLILKSWLEALPIGRIK
jgi:hypothetical protein